VVEILQCLKKHGQRLDLEIAKEVGMPLATVRQRLAGLAATGAVITCNLIRFENGKRIEAMQCRGPKVEADDVTADPRPKPPGSRVAAAGCAWLAVGPAACARALNDRKGSHCVDWRTAVRGRARP